MILLDNIPMNGPPSSDGTKLGFTFLGDYGDMKIWVDPVEFKEKFANLTSTIDIVLNEGKIFLGRRHTIVSGEAPFVKYGGEMRMNHITGKIDYSINATGHYPSSPEHFWEADAILDEAGFFAPNAVREPF